MIEWDEWKIDYLGDDLIAALGIKKRPEFRLRPEASVVCIGAARVKDRNVANQKTTFRS